MFYNDTLDNCAFCGADEANLEMCKLNGGEYFYVKCTVCRARAGAADTERNARILWNFRYIPPTQGFPVLRIPENEIQKTE